MESAITANKTRWLHESWIGRLDLILPFVFLLGLVHSFFWYWQPVWGSFLHRALMFVSEVIFFNYLHIAFTFAFIFSFPSGLHWLHQRSRQRNVILLFQCLLVCISLGILYAFGLGIFFINESIKNMSLWLMVFLNSVLFVHHGLAQIKGLSLLYNRQIENSLGLNPAEKARLRKLEAWERKLFIPLILSCSAAFCFSKWLLIGDMSLQLRFALLNTFTVIALLLCAAIWFLNLYIPKVGRTQKPIFMIRLFFNALMGVNYVAFLARLCTHGLEYICVYKKMKDSDSHRHPKATIPMALGTFAVLALAFFIHSYGNEYGGIAFTNSNHHENPVWIQFLAVFFLVTTPLHYYLDRVIFRMRDKEAREFTGSLLS